MTPEQKIVAATLAMFLQDADCNVSCPLRKICKEYEKIKGHNICQMLNDPRDEDFDE